MQVGWVKIGDFRQITGYISKTVKYKHIVSILKSNRKSYALSDGGIARDLEYPPVLFCKRIFSSTHILIFDWRPKYSTSLRQ